MLRSREHHEAVLTVHELMSRLGWENVCHRRHV